MHNTVPIESPLPRRLRILKINCSIWLHLFEILRNPLVHVIISGGHLPEDVQLVGVFPSSDGTRYPYEVCLLLESETFTPITQGDRIPTHVITFTQRILSD
jgi:hypothetical protein